MAKKHGILQNPDKGIVQDVVLRVKLILRLMADNRVNFFLKLLPVGAVIYLVSPVDLLPGALIPFIGALDDAAVLWLAAGLFVNFCPERVVQEHLDALQKVVPGIWRDSRPEDETGEILEVEAQDVPKDEN